MHPVLVVNIWRYSEKGGQELKAHLSIKSTNGSATRNSIVVSNNNCLSQFPLGVPRWVWLWLPIAHLYCLFLGFFVLFVIIS